MNEEVLTPFIPVAEAAQSLEFLREGNERYRNGQPCAHDMTSLDREVLAEAQRPFAAVVCCADSRVAPELIFDQRLGNLFVVRNAGNVVDATVRGSLAYAVEHLRVPLIVVMGHSRCGAVTAACADDEVTPVLRPLIERIKPSVTSAANVDAVARKHAQRMVAQLGEEESLQAVTIKAAFYDLVTGEVAWL